MGQQLLMEPTCEPVTLDEAKTHLRVVNTAEDGYITGLVIAARMMIEADTRRALLTQRWRYTIDNDWPVRRHLPGRHRRVDGYANPYGFGAGYPARRWRRRIVLPRPPLQTVESIQYIDVTGTLQTLDPSQYVVDLADTGEWYIEPTYDVTWPDVRQEMAAIRVTETVGYGDGPSSIPELLRMAILLLVGQWFDYRSPIPATAGGAGVQELPNAVQQLVQRYRVMY